MVERLADTEIYRRIVQWEIDHPAEPVPVELARELHEMREALERAAAQESDDGR